MNEKQKPVDEEDKSGPEWHTCPFKVEMNGDETTLCNCSPEKRTECAMDV